MTALAEPLVFLARRPAAERAADTRAGGVGAFVESGVGVDCGCRGAPSPNLRVCPECRRGGRFL